MDDILIIDSSGSIDYYSDPEQIESYPEHIDGDPVQVEASPDQIGDYSGQIDEDPEQIEVNSEQISNDNVDNIVNELGEIKDVLRNMENDRVSGDPVSDVTVHVSSNAVVSDNSIINVPLIEYSISESLLLMIFLSCLFAGMVFVIKRSLYKWN